MFKNKLIAFAALVVCGCPRSEPPVVAPDSGNSQTAGTAGLAAAGSSGVGGSSGTPDAGGLSGAPEIPSCNSRTSTKFAKRDMKKSNPRASAQTKIVGGKPSALPWAAAITVDGNAATQYCGGSLIAPDWVLTAAHCEVQEGEKVIVGATNLNASAGKARVVVEVKNHAGFDPQTNDNDIALVRLAPADSDAGAPVTPIAVYAGSSNLAGEVATVAGWGRTSEGGPSSPNLLEVAVPVITNDACSQGYAEDGIKITANMLCAGSPSGGKDSCQGDSGGPLAVKLGNGTWEQAGIVSFGVGCARPLKYGVYSRVSQYRSWIDACSK